MQVRYKVFLYSVALGLVMAVVWTAGVSLENGILKDYLAAFSLISMLAAPVDLVAALITWLFKRKEWALGLLLSGVFYSMILVISYINIRQSTP